MSAELIEQLLKSFRLTLTNIKIYPFSSPIVEKQISDLYTIIKELLKDNTFVAISEMDGKLFVNDHEYKAKDPMSISNITNTTKFFLQAGIKSITFKKELTITELKDFLEGITQRHPKLTIKEFLLRTIKEKNIKNVSIDEIEYVTILKTEQDIKSILNILSQPISGLNDLVSTLGQVFNEIDKIQDEKSKNNLINMIAKHVSKLDTSIVCELFTQPLPQKIESSGFKLQVFNNLTKQNVEEIFNEIINWCKQLRKQTSSESEYIERLQHLKEFIKLIVHSPISKLVPIEVFEELFKIGLLDALPEWVLQQKEEKKSWIQQLDEFLSTNEPTKLLQEQFLKNLNENIEKLSIIGLDDKIEKIIQLMSENFTNPVVKLRQLAASSMVDISNKLSQYQKVHHLKSLINNILKILVKEQDDTAFSQHIVTLKNSLSTLIISQDYNSFKDYLQHLILISHEIENIYPERARTIRSLAELVFHQTKESIIAVLEEQQENKIEKILWFLQLLGKISIDLIINAIISCKNCIIIDRLTSLLLNIDDQQAVIERLGSYLTQQTSVHKLARIIEILDRFNFDFSTQLRNLYPYTSYANKIAILNYLQKKATEENLTWLSALLSNEEEKILEHVIDILIHLDYRYSSDRLIRLLNTKNSDLKKRVCIALGIFKEPKAIPKLKKIIKSKKTLFKKGESLDVRITATWALGNFISLPEIKMFFQKLALNSKDTAISNIAKEILQRK
ncbi:MAG: HEAT repeat domain-containing protein [Elusimicrobiota bacterium]|nr:HEAT repeat domain-containing protein [Elusimicrobiota bacterium]